MILTIRDDERKEQHHNASERNNRRYIIGITEWRRKCQLLPQMSLESILAKKVTTGLLGKTNNETNKLVVGLWKTSQEYEVTTDHYRKQLLTLDRRRDEHFFHKDDKEITWIIDKHHK